VSERIKATVFVPTWFGETYLEEVFESIFRQDVDFKFEVLTYDTSSTDRTPEIIQKYAKKYKNLRHKTIKKEDFSHGRVRNEAAHDAKGEIVVYLTQDATPAHDRWLYEIVKPFELSDKVVGVMGKQVPRSYCFPLLKYEIIDVFRGFGPDFGTTIFYKDMFIKDEGTLDAVSFYSDVNSAARRDFLVGKLPYRNVSYAEDQLFGRDIIEAGYYKVYAPRASVIHSNDMKLGEYRYRMFDETIGLRKIGKKVPVPSRGFVVKAVLRGVIKGILTIPKDHQYSWKRKLYWLMLNPIYYIEKWRGVRLGVMVSLDDTEILDKNSLEKRREH
jgi:rhamnosyltransferase